MIIGLTGGIGSGKSTVAKVFETMGCVIYNSDQRAKDLYFENSIRDKITQLLGKDAYLSSTSINKEFISSKVFSNQSLLTQLNNIIHPAVKEDFLNFKNQLPLNTILIKESALLFETKIDKEADSTILVTAPVHLRIERVMKRNGLSENEIRKRIEQQWSDEQKIPLSTYVIINDSKQAIIPQVLKIMSSIKK